MTAILDIFGNPARQRTTGASLYADSQTGGLRATRADYAYDHSQFLSKAKFRAMLSDARYIYTQFSPVSAASTQKASFVSSSGWTPVFTGQDKAYGARALAALRPALARSTNKGFSFDKIHKMASTYLDIDGGFFKLLAIDKRRFPVTQILEAHRIGSRSNQTVVTEGRYKGKRIQNGIIYSADGAEIAYQFLGATPKDDRRIPAASLMHCADWTFSSENRPFPSVAYGILDFYDAKETRGFQKIKNKLHSALSILETNDTGRNINVNTVPGAAEESADTSTSGLRSETYEAGMIRYLRSKSGGDIKAFESNTPANEAQEFESTIIASALLAMRWSREMLDLSRLKGSGFRGFASIINQAIADRHQTICAFAKPELLFKISALQARGDIPEHPEWDQWSFPQPTEFNVDPLNTQKLDEANARIGRTSIPRLIRKGGEDPDEILRENGEYLQKRNALAAKLGVEPQELGTLSKPGDSYLINNDDTDEDDRETESDREGE